MAESRKQKALISVRVTNKFKEDLEKIAEDKGNTLPDLVRYVLMEYLEKERNNKKMKDTE
jgi:antitoxin component of RelBE/YafQ-DinJ toxin-antitoxin module